MDRIRKDYFGIKFQIRLYDEKLLLLFNSVKKAEYAQVAPYRNQFNYGTSKACFIISYIEGQCFRSGLDLDLGRPKLSPRKNEKEKKLLFCLLDWGLGAFSVAWTFFVWVQEHIYDGF
jgi:hypothetical protein